MKGWMLTTLEAAFIFLNGISPMHCCGHYISVLHWDVFRGEQGKMVVSGVPFKSGIRTVKCKRWCQWLCDGIVYPDVNWSESPFSSPITSFLYTPYCGLSRAHLCMSPQKSKHGDSIQCCQFIIITVRIAIVGVGFVNWTVTGLFLKKK